LGFFILEDLGDTAAAGVSCVSTPDENMMQVGNIRTKSLTLVPHTPTDIRARIEAMVPDQRAQVSPDWLARAYAATAPDPWTLGFAIVHQATGAVIGMCGFKGPPGADGIVELSYGVNGEHEGRGYATEAAEALVAFAFSRQDIHLVCAHTLQDMGASARVLAKCGFRLVGQVVDPEDGLVWRWERVDG
jgi:RimJ/RimL family protein N-acetyltransferase